MSYNHFIHISAEAIRKSRSIATDDRQIAFYESSRITPNRSVFNAFVMSYGHTIHTTAGSIRKTKSASIFLKQLAFYNSHRIHKIQAHSVLCICLYSVFYICHEL